MKLILNSQDIESLIKDKYDGVNSIDIDEKISVSLDIDIEKFQASLKTPIITQAQQKSVSPEEKLKQEVKTGVMASGGVARTVRNVG